MKTLLTTAAALALTTTFAFAGQGNPGGQFIDKWDQNEDGIVTLAEATERRTDIFAAFDQDDDGSLSPDDYALFDEARANDQADNHGGQGQGRNAHKNSQGMTLAFNDVDGDGQVSLEEFTTRTADWVAMMDRNNDGVISPKDFGRGN